MKYKEDDIVLCTVKNVEGTTVFLELEEGGLGNMTLSEVAPGRIRNIREFIAPNKKVVCKVLRVHGNHVELSLRRVTAKEREGALEHYKKERTFVAMLKPILKEKLEETLGKIKEKYELAELMDLARENPKVMEKFVNKENMVILEKIFAEKKEKEKEVKKTIFIKSMSESGLQDIQNVLSTTEAHIHYLGSSRFSISVKNADFKKANTQLDALIKTMAEKAKKLKIEFEIK